VPCGGRIADVVRVDLEGFWPSRRGDAFDEWCRWGAAPRRRR